MVHLVLLLILVGQSIGGPPRTPIPALESAGQSNRVELSASFVADTSALEPPTLQPTSQGSRKSVLAIIGPGSSHQQEQLEVFKETDRPVEFNGHRASSTPTHSHSDEDIPSTSLVDGNSLTLGTVEASDTETGNMCAICLDELESELRTLRCKHTFHKDCIEKWFTAQDDHRSIIKTCPNCRTKVKLTFHQVLRPYWELMTGLPGVCKIIWTHRNELRLLFLVTNFF
ncbi:hypothetical protein PSTG_14686 [Puccinia striiformis f. sp. tritici PST-78]|uniref:RING-type domain-containing protein n=1 Tax=Puccinia striiformis f. sp. tritici PST-78 TaxID=1165861 RepID=A0A0L0UXW7_9BASI|nr:hypothetical protein PSTG_14686 [Puccinia striiformis f. sp. tritici PST-78]